MKNHENGKIGQKTYLIMTNHEKTVKFDKKILFKTENFINRGI